MNIKHHVTLTEKEREELKTLIKNKCMVSYAEC